MEKGGGSGCCNTATYSTGEEALAVDGERGAGAEAWKKAEGVVAVIQQHTQREKEALAVDGERGKR